MRLLHWYWQTNAGGIHRVVSDLVGAQRHDPSLEVRCAVGRAGALAGRPTARCTPGDVTCLDLRHGFDFSRYGAAREALRWADLVHMHGYNGGIQINNMGVCLHLVLKLSLKPSYS